MQYLYSYKLGSTIKEGMIASYTLNFLKFLYYTINILTNETMITVQHLQAISLHGEFPSSGRVIIIGASLKSSTRGIIMMYDSSPLFGQISTSVTMQKGTAHALLVGGASLGSIWNQCPD